MFSSQNVLIRYIFYIIHILSIVYSRRVLYYNSTVDVLCNTVHLMVDMFCIIGYSTVVIELSKHLNGVLNSANYVP
jgi:hypothetical protein